MCVILCVYIVRPWAECVIGVVEVAWLGAESPSMCHIVPKARLPYVYVLIYAPGHLFEVIQTNQRMIGLDVLFVQRALNTRSQTNNMVVNILYTIYSTIFRVCLPKE